MNLRLKLFRYFCFLIFIFSSLNAGAKIFPKSFQSEYQLLNKNNNLGKVIVGFSQESNQYEIKAVTKAEGIMKLLGDREVLSRGRLSKDRFLPTRFEIKNKKKPKKNILAEFDYKNKQIKLSYKKEVKNFEFKENIFDLITYLYQFNFELLSKKNYAFEVFEGKKIRTYLYKKVRQEFIEIGTKSFKTDVYEGMIKEKNNSKHYLWILRKPYRIPLKIEIRTDIGINIDQVLIKTNLLELE